MIFPAGGKPYEKKLTPFSCIARCGFFPDKKVPSGRLQPYVGIGFADFVVRYGGTTNSRVSVALVTDAGVRYMLAKKSSVSLGFQYRHAQPNFPYNLFSGIAELAYHF